MAPFRTRHDNGRAFPLRNSGVSVQALVQMERDTRARTAAVISSKHARRTLENPIVFMNFMRKVLSLKKDIDPQVIDRTLEFDEALAALKRIYPDLRTDPHDTDEFKQYLEYLDDVGIHGRRIQDFIIRTDKPLTEQELTQIAYLLNMRPPQALQLDKALKARKAHDARDWMHNYNRSDIPGERI